MAAQTSHHSIATTLTNFSQHGSKHRTPPRPPSPREEQRHPSSSTVIMAGQPFVTGNHVHGSSDPRPTPLTPPVSPSHLVIFIDLQPYSNNGGLLPSHLRSPSPSSSSFTAGIPFVNFIPPGAPPSSSTTTAAAYSQLDTSCPRPAFTITNTTVFNQNGQQQPWPTSSSTNTIVSHAALAIIIKLQHPPRSQAHTLCCTQPRATSSWSSSLPSPTRYHHLHNYHHP